MLSAPLAAGRVAGGLVALSVIAVGTVGVVGTFLGRSQTLESTLTAGRLVITTDAGDVTVHAGPADRPIRVVRTLRWSLHRPTSSVAAQPDPGHRDTAAITGRCADLTTLGNCGVDVDVTMPPDTDLQITTTAGDVQVDGAAAALAVLTTAGDVRLTASGTRSVTLQATAGDISAHFAVAPDRVLARTTAGDVRVGLPPGTAYLVRATTAAGNPTVTVPTSPTSGHTVDVASQAGNVSVVADPAPAP